MGNLHEQRWVNVGGGECSVFHGIRPLRQASSHMKPCLDPPAPPRGRASIPNAHIYGPGLACWGQAMRQAGAVLRRHPTMRQCLRAARSHCPTLRAGSDSNRPQSGAHDFYCRFGRKRCLAGAGWEFSLAKLISVLSALPGQRRSATAAMPHKGSAYGLKFRAGLSTSSRFWPGRQLGRPPGSL